jgi:predicted NAD/FAD-binding protein
MADIRVTRPGGKRVAIVGSGIAGNVAAYLLRRQHDVTVFEANDYVGGHTNTVDVPLDESGKTLPIDTGFIVFNDRTYPHFVRLLERLQQPTRESVMTFSVQSAGRGIEYNGASLNALFAQRRNILSPPFYRMVRDILRFNQEAPRLLEGAFDDTRLGEYLNNNGYSPEFGDLYLVPMAAAIWSAQPDRIWDMPVHFLVRFFRNHGLLQLRDRPVWRTIDGGSREYVRKLVDGHRDRIRLSTPVRSLRRIDGGVLVMTDRFEAERFDYVVLACHSDQALHLLADPTPAETDVLSAIEYQENEAILHTDENVLPRRRRCWAAWNYHIPRDIPDA